MGAVFFDLQKAFDSVPHKLLIDKLRSISLAKSFIARWICSYLMNRKQYVVLNGERSTTCNASKNLARWAVSIILSPLSHQLPIWCAVGDKVVAFIFLKCMYTIASSCLT